MAEKIQTRQTDQGFDAFLESVDPAKRQDFETLASLMAQVSGEKPVVWSNGTVGYGTFTYRCSNKVENEWMLLGLAPRKAAFTLLAPFHKVPDLAARLSRLGKHKMGVGCLYVTKLKDIDMAELESLLAVSLSTP